jgi:hypothetical protein
VTSRNTGEGVVDKSELVFTRANWNAPQTVTVTGVDDAVRDGASQYLVSLGLSQTSDANYQAMKPVDVSLANPAIKWQVLQRNRCRSPHLHRNGQKPLPQHLRKTSRFLTHRGFEQVLRQMMSCLHLRKIRINA